MRGHFLRALSLVTMACTLTMAATIVCAPAAFGQQGTVLYAQTFQQAQASAALAGAMAGAAEAPMGSTAASFWYGDSLCVYGTVTNNSATSAGPCPIAITVRGPGGDVIAQTTCYASIYELKPGVSASYGTFVSLPDYAGSAMSVSAEATGIQPCQYADVVDLRTASGESLPPEDGVRVWSCGFENNTPYMVTNPIAGGWEYDADGLLVGTLMHQPVLDYFAAHSVVGVTAYGYNVGAMPVSMDSYGQAIAVRHGSEFPVYRFYNYRNNSHLYTILPSEAANVRTLNGTYRDEGIAYYSDEYNNTMPLFRFRNLRTGSYFYTADPAEVERVFLYYKDVYKAEGPGYKVNLVEVSDSIPVYRFFNLRNGSHFYTASTQEAELVKVRWPGVWQYEGIGFWVGQ